MPIASSTKSARANPERHRETQRRNRAKYLAADPVRYREQLKQARLRYRARHGEAVNAKTRQWRKENPELASYVDRKAKLKKYGVTVEQFDAMVFVQGAGCAICGRVLRLEVDHNHDTHKVRELLCHPCNSVLGLMNEDPLRLEIAAAYLRKHRDASER